MARLLRDSQLPCNVSGLDITALKAIVCYVAEAFDTEMRKPREEVGLEYTLPDGNVVEIGDARFRCPEALFQPGLLGVPHGGLPSTVIEAVEYCDPDLRGQLYSHLVLSGGNTLYPGLERRLAADLTDRVSGVNVGVEAHPERLYFPWVGGAIAATSAAMATRWIVEDEYREFGPTSFRANACDRPHRDQTGPPHLSAPRVYAILSSPLYPEYLVTTLPLPFYDFGFLLWYYP
eukprot:TRINITY_DN11229_c0_g1_i1.p3 TRINITY_DN11229_c0_g1~~TRINITY_DN11229_c0_g1_i1.p3  ORF type:complete len:233 (+),score=59.19 TRINITY_DN11229_c0_g1_i1:656-1354(+)